MDNFGASRKHYGFLGRQSSTNVLQELDHQTSMQTTKQSLFRNCYSHLRLWSPFHIAVQEPQLALPYDVDTTTGHPAARRLYLGTVLRSLICRSVLHTEPPGSRTSIRAEIEGYRSRRALHRPSFFSKLRLFFVGWSLAKLASLPPSQDDHAPTTRRPTHAYAENKTTHRGTCPSRNFYTGHEYRESTTCIVVRDPPRLESCDVDNTNDFFRARLAFHCTVSHAPYSHGQKFLPNDTL